MQLQTREPIEPLSNGIEILLINVHSYHPLRERRVDGFQAISTSDACDGYAVRTPPVENIPEQSG